MCVCAQLLVPYKVDSGVRRSESILVSEKLKKEGVRDPAVILARSSSSYALCALWVRSHFPQYAAALMPNPARTQDSYGLLRELNTGGSVPFATSEDRARAVAKYAFSHLSCFPPS